jgi:hypothetical protein
LLVYRPEYSIQWGTRSAASCHPVNSCAAVCAFQVGDAVPGATAGPGEIGSGYRSAETSPSRAYIAFCRSLPSTSARRVAGKFSWRGPISPWGSQNFHSKGDPCEIFSSLVMGQKTTGGHLYVFFWQISMGALRHQAFVFVVFKKISATSLQGWVDGNTLDWTGTATLTCLPDLWHLQPTRPGLCRLQGPSTKPGFALSTTALLLALSPGGSSVLASLLIANVQRAAASCQGCRLYGQSVRP